MIVSLIITPSDVRIFTEKGFDIIINVQIIDTYFLSTVHDFKELST